MVKNYFFNRLRVLVVPVLLCFTITLQAQSAKIFTLSDFDLTGPVKSCMVTTTYGKEEFNFNKEGLLTKHITRFSESDYDITYYKFSNGEISEKRVENYRDGVFDRQTSIANIYVVDTTGNRRKVTEKIVSYSKEFLDQYEYFYNEDGVLEAIKRNNNNGIENTTVSYKDVDGEYTTSYILNDEIQKSLRISQRKTKASGMHFIALEKEYFEGKPFKAVEKIHDNKDRLISEQQFNYDIVAKTFKSTLKINFFYNDLGMLIKKQMKEGSNISVKEYIYQYDNGEKGNWIKQIITPDNTYITRKIKYYTPIVEEVKAEEPK
ncbi:hypothetical protein KO500_06585 [Cellulophaga baltica]|uniref:hypothetical protein n=1 Tax=Cellulophaga TaxID=104264 RepID=UPI001C066B99|nr:MULTISPECIES: hypothetical protein [Cellulophaga]MBU2996091.1 hypothetical protein [Cellulophaga baltica]MDO6767486.1 hypothetical protein [Cellulophaga sp. 1_MG-2023]